MRFPKKQVKIGYFTYGIEFVDDIPKDLKLKEKALELWGFCDNDNQVLYFKKGMNRQRFIEVFLHECLHAIEESYGIDLGEKKVNRLGLSLAALFKENDIRL
jgi:hypothetical protein